MDGVGAAGVQLGRARALVYCVVPRDLAPQLHEQLRRHFQADADVAVIVERRGIGRRSGADRRGARRHAADAAERRRLRAGAGRRAGERRATLVPVSGPVQRLPRKARAYAGRLAFFERLEPSGVVAEDLDTARLVSAIQGGDREAFALLYMRYFDRVYSYLRLLFRDPHEAEDATQQVFVKVLEALPGYERREGVPFRAWLFVIVRNHALSALRRRGRIQLEEPDELAWRRERGARDDGEDVSALRWLSDQELLKFIERLPLSQQQVLVLRYMLDLSIAQVAEILERTPNEVELLQRRAQQVLRARLLALGRAPRAARRVRWRIRPSQAIVVRERRFALRP